MTDALCAWCDLNLTCVLRNVTEEESACAEKDSSKMLVTDGGVCPVCADHVECVSCAQVCVKEVFLYRILSLTSLSKIF